MSINDHDGDYVLVHKSKAKISRARRLVIGIMAIGAVAAVANAGTFASFSASTTNDATFKTGRLELTNSVNSATACSSADLGPGATSTADANLDNNDTDCDTLFAANLRPGVVSTSDIAVDNNSSYANGELYLFGVDADANNTCNSVVNDATFRGGLKGSGNLCSAAEIKIQEYTSSAYTTKATGCIFPYDNTNPCDNTFSAAQAAAKFSQFPMGYSSGSGNRDLGAHNTNTHTTGERFFRVWVYMPNGGYSGVGIGNDNLYQNLKTDVKLRWLLQDRS